MKSTSHSKNNIDNKSTLPAGPAVHTKDRQLRILGTSVTLTESLKSKAEEDLGITIEFTTLDGTEAQRRGALAPGTFDIYDQWFHDIDLIWPTGSIQAIDIQRITNWADIVDLPKTGCLSSGKTTAPGGDPGKRLFVQRDGSLGSLPTNFISMMPTVHNADSFAVIGKGTETIDSWSALIDPKWSGKVVLQSDAAIGCLDMIMALRAAGSQNFFDIGNLSLNEIDLLSENLTKFIHNKQFYKIWVDEAEAIEAFQAGGTVIGSLWWSGAIKLRARGIPVVMATPKEGYRGWVGGVGLSSHLKGYELDIGYEYLNWWLSGYPSAFMVRNGAYISNPTAAKEYLSQAEWDFWYEGKPAVETIFDNQNNPIFQIGESRGGGSYYERMSQVAVWDAVMDEHNYLVRRWENALA